MNKLKIFIIWKNIIDKIGDANVMKKCPLN